MHEGLHKLLDKDKAEALLLISRTRLIKAGELFIEHGEVPAKIAFVSSGLFRYVYVNDKGDEFTKGIISENNFISSYSAMIAKRPSYFAIEALEDAQVLEIHWTDFSQLLEADVFWLRFLLKFLEKGFISKEKRERDLLLLDAETRYKNFLNEFPGIDQRLKQGIIASYLGIKPETLSRIRKKIIF
jgi:CRP-like cAMP-binding protein